MIHYEKIILKEANDLINLDLIKYASRLPRMKYI